MASPFKMLRGILPKSRVYAFPSCFPHVFECPEFCPVGEQLGGEVEQAMLEVAGPQAIERFVAINGTPVTSAAQLDEPCEKGNWIFGRAPGNLLDTSPETERA